MILKGRKYLLEIDIVTNYFNALLKNDLPKIKSLFSDKIGVHNGYYIDDFIIAEVNEFNKYSKFYDLKHNNFSIIKTFNKSGFQSFLVLNDNGHLVFDHGVSIVDGKIIGDGSFYQKVTKNKYRRNTAGDCFSVHRSVAVWCPYSPQSPRFMLVKNGSDFKVQQGNLNFTASTKTDGFYSYEFNVVNDDMKSKLVDFRIIDPHYSENTTVYFHGDEHPYFFSNMFPVIDNKKLLINKVESLIWSVAVFFDNGTSQHIEFPRIEEFTFDHHIVKAIVTDALDNDWEIFKG